jgi:hypothetical protein
MEFKFYKFVNKEKSAMEELTEIKNITPNIMLTE